MSHSLPTSPGTWPSWMSLMICSMAMQRRKMGLLCHRSQESFNFKGLIQPACKFPLQGLGLNEQELEMRSILIRVQQVRKVASSFFPVLAVNLVYLFRNFWRQQCTQGTDKRPTPRISSRSGYKPVFCSWSISQPPIPVHSQNTLLIGAPVFCTHSKQLPPGATSSRWRLEESLWRFVWGRGGEGKGWRRWSGQSGGWPDWTGGEGGFVHNWTLIYIAMYCAALPIVPGTILPTKCKIALCIPIYQSKSAQLPWFQVTTPTGRSMGR